MYSHRDQPYTLTRQTHKESRMPYYRWSIRFNPKRRISGNATTIDGAHAAAKAQIDRFRDTGRIHA